MDDVAEAFKCKADGAYVMEALFVPFPVVVSQRDFQIAYCFEHGVCFLKAVHDAGEEGIYLLGILVCPFGAMVICSW